MKIQIFNIPQSVNTKELHEQFTRAFDASIKTDSQKFFSRIIDLDRLTHEDYKNFIKNKHSTIWLQAPVANDEASLEDSTQWLQEFITSFHAFFANNSAMRV